MLPADKEIRDLLPFMHIDLDDGNLFEEGSNGSLIAEAPFPLSAASPALDQSADPVSLDGGGEGGHALVPMGSLPHSPTASQVSALGSGDPEHVQVDTPTLSLDIAITKPLVVTNGGEAGAGSRQEEVREERGQDDDKYATSKVSSGSDNVDGNTADDDSHAHSIAVRQDAEVDQDASIIVDGYEGKVVARLHIDQDLLMDQDVDINFTIDGDGYFSILLDQDMRIEQNIDIDLKIFDADGVLYVDVFLKDRIAVDQDTILNMQIDNGPRGGTVAIDQNIEMDQDVDIDIDIEDDLEENYLVNVDIDVEQDVNVVQDATVDITDHPGEVDMGIKTLQVASVDQETTVWIDFIPV